MKILSTWLRSYLPDLSVTDQQLADDLTLRGIAVEGVFDLGPGNGSLFEMDITTNRVDAMNHYGIAREAAAIYDIPLDSARSLAPGAKPAKQPFSVRIEATDLCGRFTARVLRNVNIVPSAGRSRAAFLPARTETDQQRRGRHQLCHHGDRSSNPRLRSRQA